MTETTYDLGAAQREEGLMASHSITPLVAVSASGPGALSGYECRCSCGLVLRSSLRTLAAQDAAEHAAWHARKAGR